MLRDEKMQTLFANMHLPVKPDMKATGAKLTITEVENVDIKDRAVGFSSFLENAGFTRMEEDMPLQRVVTI